MPINGRELINAVLKPRLRLLLLVGLYELLLLSGVSALRAGNRQKGFAGLVNIRGRGSSNKDHLNFLQGEGPRGRGGLSTKSSDRRAGISQKETAAGVGTRPDNIIMGDLE